MATKQDIRSKVFRLRRETPDSVIEEKSRIITELVKNLPEFQEASTILAYADYRHEVITRYLIEEAWRLGKKTAVPKVHGKEMLFYEIQSFDALSPGYFGIPEPDNQPLATWQDGLMIMPGVAFDSTLNRVGYGGGFYDRFLEQHTELIRLAVAFDFQMMESVPTEPTDIRPQILVTESGVLRD